MIPVVVEGLHQEQTSAVVVVVVEVVEPFALVVVAVGVPHLNQF
jgi:hypothetical protein